MRTRIHDGVAIGMHGARLGLKSAGTTLQGAPTGRGDQARQTHQERADALKEPARHLCQQLPALVASGAAAFAPYLQAAEQQPGHGIEAGQTPRA